MSANVWFEEVNTGLLNELRKTVKIRNESGLLIPLRDEAYMVRKPEEDFKFETYPCVSIYNLSYTHDPFRYNPEPVTISKDSVKSVMEESAIPFNLLYQIDFWSRYQTDMDTMTRTWLTSHFRQFNLAVVDDGGTERTCNCLVQGSVVKSDLILNGERLFHSIIKLLIWVELDDEIRYNKPIAGSRNIGLQQT